MATLVWRKEVSTRTTLPLFLLWPPPLNSVTAVQQFDRLGRLPSLESSRRGLNVAAAATATYTQPLHFMKPTLILVISAPLPAEEQSGPSRPEPTHQGTLTIDSPFAMSLLLRFSNQNTVPCTHDSPATRTLPRVVITAQQPEHCPVYS